MKKLLFQSGVLLLLLALMSTGHAKPPRAIFVFCDQGDSIQGAVDKAKRPSTIFIDGVCVEDVNITKDDITLSGNAAGASCNKANPGGTGIINGTVTVEGVRARIEHLTLTGSGVGVDIIHRAGVRLVCNDISNNELSGVYVRHSSNAVLRDNTLSGNGTLTTDPFISFESGLFAGEASSVDSRGNTYEDNQYSAIEIDTQSSFRNGAFLPREFGHPADPNERDIITERGCAPSTGAGCFTTDEGPVAIEVFNGGLVALRNAEVNGEIEAHALSSFTVDDDAAVQGNIANRSGSVVTLSDASFLGDRSVTYTGKLVCSGGSQTFFSKVQCGQTCAGPIPGSCF